MILLPTPRHSRSGRPGLDWLDPLVDVLVDLHVPFDVGVELGDRGVDTVESLVDPRLECHEVLVDSRLECHEILLARRFGTELGLPLLESGDRVQHILQGRLGHRRKSNIRCEAGSKRPDR